MTDMLSEARAPLIQAPIAWLARELLAVDASVKAVMVVGDKGSGLAHEIATEYDEEETREEDERTITFYASEPKQIFFLRLRKGPSGDDVSDRIQATISSPTLAVTR
jgi:hypothetical protein